MQCRAWFALLLYMAKSEMGHSELCAGRLREWLVDHERQVAVNHGAEVTKLVRQRKPDVG